MTIHTRRVQRKASGLGSREAETVNAGGSREVWHRCRRSTHLGEQCTASRHIGAWERELALPLDKSYSVNLRLSTQDRACPRAATTGRAGTTPQVRANSRDNVSRRDLTSKGPAQGSRRRRRPSRLHPAEERRPDGRLSPPQCNLHCGREYAASRRDACGLLALTARLSALLATTPAALLLLSVADRLLCFRPWCLSCVWLCVPGAG